MRLTTLFLLLVGGAALGTIGWVFWRATADTREWNELLSWAGKDIGIASPEERARFADLVHKRIPPEQDDLPPFKLLVLSAPDSSQRIIVYYSGGLRMIPSACRIRLDVLDDRRRLLSRTSASAGWRIEATGAKGPSRSDLSPWTFEVESARVINGADIARQIYALVNDQPVLIRLEDSAGKYHPNHYRAPNHTIGPRIPNRTPEEWEQALSSTNPCEVLGALVWLGGIHESPIIETWSRPGVKGRLEELTRSPHPWIAEAAREALTPEEK